MENTITEYSTIKKYKILGFNDDQCHCDVCGKQELKGTYALESYETGEIIRAGSSCGARMAGWTVKELTAKYKASEKAKIDAAKKEFSESSEYIDYEKAIDFLNEEREAIWRKLSNYPPEEERIRLKASERTLESRMAHIRPFSIAKHKKSEEIIAKYNLGKVYLG